MAFVVFFVVLDSIVVVFGLTVVVVFGIDNFGVFLFGFAVVTGLVGDVFCFAFGLVLFTGFFVVVVLGLFVVYLCTYLYSS